MRDHSRTERRLQLRMNPALLESLSHENDLSIDVCAHRTEYDVSQHQTILKDLQQRGSSQYENGATRNDEESRSHWFAGAEREASSSRAPNRRWAPLKNSAKPSPEGLNADPDETHEVFLTGKTSPLS